MCELGKDNIMVNVIVFGFIFSDGVFVIGMEEIMGEVVRKFSCLILCD